jgi:glycosyltransferase involved in cell wall biosynthesis
MGVFGLLTAQTLDTPIVTTIHQLPWFITAYLPELPGLHGTIEYGLWEYSRWLNQQSHVMVVPTATIAETIHAKAGFRPEVISNGVDLDYFNNEVLARIQHDSLCQKYGLEPERPTILHVGRLDTDKQVEFVIRAAAKVMERTTAQLLVIGDGEHRGDLMQLTQQLGIDKRSHFPGFVSPNGDLPDLYRLATVFITASEIETQGLVLLEALASGLPVVATNATCIPELVIDGRNGFLVNPRDVDGMAVALNKIICNPILKQKMGKAGRAIVQELSIAASLDKHENLYSDLIAKHQVTSKPAHTFKLSSLSDIGQNILQQLSNIRL